MPRSGHLRRPGRKTGMVVGTQKLLGRRTDVSMPPPPAGVTSRFSLGLLGSVLFCQFFDTLHMFFMTNDCEIIHFHDNNVF